MRPRDKRPQRRKVNLLVTFWRCDQPSGYRSGRIVNLSVSGAWIETGVPLPPPTVLEMQLLLDGESIQIQGEVVRSLGGTEFASGSDDSGMAVRFCQPDADDVRALTAFGLNP